MSTAPTTAFGAGLTEDQRDAVRRSKTRLELAGHLNDGVVTRYVLRARLAELDDLDKRFLARHPIIRSLLIGWGIVVLALMYRTFDRLAAADEGMSWMRFSGPTLVTFSVVQLIVDYVVLRRSRRRERALIEALLYQEQILPPDP